MGRLLKFNVDPDSVKQCFAAISQLGGMYLPAREIFRRDVWPGLLADPPRKERNISDAEEAGFVAWTDIRNYIHKTNNAKGVLPIDNLFVNDGESNLHIAAIYDDAFIEAISMLLPDQSPNLDKLYLQLTDELSSKGVYRRQMRIMTVTYRSGKWKLDNADVHGYIIEYRTATNHYYAVNGIEGSPNCAMKSDQNFVCLEIPDIQ